MALLLFDEVAVAVPHGDGGIPFSLPKSLVRRYVKVNEYKMKLLGSWSGEKHVIQVESTLRVDSV